MWIVYELESLRVVGLTGHSSTELTRDKALRGVLMSKRNAPIENYGAVQVVERDRAREILSAYPDRLALEGTPQNPRIVIRPVRAFFLEVEADAPDKHPVDGIPEIAADGKSTTLIRLQKMDHEGEHVGHGHDDELFLRASHGALLDAAGEKEVSRIKLVNGKSAFRVRSERAKRVATVRIFNLDLELRDAEIQIEFI